LAHDEGKSLLKGKPLLKCGSFYYLFFDLACFSHNLIYNEDLIRNMVAVNRGFESYRSQIESRRNQIAKENMKILSTFERVESKNYRPGYLPTHRPVYIQEAFYKSLMEWYMYKKIAKEENL